MPTRHILSGLQAFAGVSVCSACRVRVTATARRWQTRRFSTIRPQAAGHDARSIQTSGADSKPFYAHISNKSLIRLQGDDVVHFLNGLLPAKLQPLPETQSLPIFTAFLSAKGRILYDAFIYPPTQARPDGPWYIEVDNRSTSALFSHLKKHKLRSKFKLEKVNPKELEIYYVWPSSNYMTNLPNPKVGGQDPRPSMGMRFIASPSPSPSQPPSLDVAEQKPSILDVLQSHAERRSLDDYTIHRMTRGHAEGPVELIPNSALPQESNIEFSGGIDFHKGCYLGQELTIRTHHTGVVRKRILPCQIYSETTDAPSPEQNEPIYDETALTSASESGSGSGSGPTSTSTSQVPSETNISKQRSSSSGRSGRSTGKWLNGTGNIGLALCRLEMMTDIQLTAEGTNYNPTDQFILVWEDSQADADDKTAVRQVKIKPFVPPWLRRSIEDAIKSRSERGLKKKRALDDEVLDDDHDRDQNN